MVDLSEEIKQAYKDKVELLPKYIRDILMTKLKALETSSKKMNKPKNKTIDAEITD